MGFEQQLAVAGFLLLLSILVSKFSVRFGVPSLLLFILVGMVAGSDGLGKIQFDDLYVAQSVGTIALIYILFSGGLDTPWKQVKPVVKGAFSLATLGVVITALTVGLFATLVLDFTFLQGLLLGAIISSTDAAAVFATLRAKSVEISQKLKSVVELESGSNDPMAIFLTLALIQAISGEASSLLSFIVFFLMQMGIGAVGGLLLGKILVKVLDIMNFEYPGLYPVFLLSSVLLSYGLLTLIGGNGFLAVYLMGLIIGNSKVNQKKIILSFYDGIAWFAQIAMFLLLGLLVFPTQLVPVTYHGLMISLFLIGIARPIGVFLSLLLSKYSLEEKLMISWMGLRGAVPIILATFPLLAGIEGAVTIFNIVFFVVITSTLIQGTTMLWIANIIGIRKSIGKIVK